MNVKIIEAHHARDAIFAKLAEQTEHSDYAAQHDVWPCVRKGAGERWLKARGEAFPPSKAQSLYFLRGKSAEALITGNADEQEMIVYNRVSNHPDLNRADLARLIPEFAERYPLILFGEIKSTNYSSFNWYKLVKAGKISFSSNDKFPMRNYVEQCANYCVVTRTNRCLLIIYFLHGDYADRRSKCPECGNQLGDWIDDFYRQCVGCGYKAKKLDLWAYELEFSAGSLYEVERDVYTVRPAQFYAAIESSDEAGLLAAAPPSPCFYCRSCKVGERLECENAGKEFD